MLNSNKIKEITDEELLQEHQLYKEQLYRTTASGKTSFCVQTLAEIEVELDNRNVEHTKFAFWDFGDADWIEKLEDSSEKIDHIIIDPKGETEMIGNLIRSSLQNGRDPSLIMLHLPNGDELQLNDLDDEKVVAVLNAMFGLQWTTEEYCSEGKYAKYFAMDEAPVIYEHVMMSTTRKYSPKNQLKTVKQPFYRQFEKKRF